MTFDWDDHKAQTNLAKHGVSFTDASLAILDEFALEEYDKKHSTLTEKRYTCLGASGGQVLYVVYTVRYEGTARERYRIITARFAEADESETYEQEKFASGYFG